MTCNKKKKFSLSEWKCPHNAKSYSLAESSTQYLWSASSPVDTEGEKEAQRQNWRNLLSLKYVAGREDDYESKMIKY